METKALLTGRRSVTYFDKTKELDEKLLKEIIDLAVLAPSAFNLQPWRIIAAKTPEGRGKLFNVANKQDKIMEAPVTLIIIGNKEGYSDLNPVWKEMLETLGGRQEIVDGAKQSARFLYGTSEERKIKFAESNAGLLAMSVMIAAGELGVDSHPMSGIDFEGIHREFGLNENEDAVMLIALGYADKSKKLHSRRPRRNFEDIVTIV